MKINRESDWDFGAVLTKFQNEVVSREQCKLMSKNNGAKKTKSHRTRDRNDGDELTTGSSLFSSTNRGGSGGGKNVRAPSCVYCGEQGHKAVQCSRVTGVTERRGIIQREKRCFNCLR